MGKKMPRMNAPDELVPYLKALLARIEELEDEQREAASKARFAGKMAAGATNFASDVHVDQNATAAQVAINTADIEELKKRLGLPPGGSSGSVIRKSDKGEAVWMPNLAGITPILYIYLEDGNASFEWGGAFEGDLAQWLPAVNFFNNGRGFYAVTMAEGGGSFGQDFPINYEVIVTPHFDGELFDVSVRSDGWPYPSNTQFDLMISNGSYDYTAKVDFGSDDVANQYDYRYKDSGVIPWAYYPNPVTNPGYYFNRLELPVRGHVAWIVEQAKGNYSNNLTPVLMTDDDNNGVPLTIPRDEFYYRYVQSRKHFQPWTHTGEVSVVAPGEHSPLVNRFGEARRIGLVTAQLAAPPSGSALEVDVLIDGVSIFTSPLAIAPGASSAEGEPTAYTHGPDGSTGVAMYAYPMPNSVMWLPGQSLEVVVPSVGSAFAGSDLAVQVYYG